MIGACSSRGATPQARDLPPLVGSAPDIAVAVQRENPHDRDKRAFAAARVNETVESYVRYLNEYPSGVHADDAKRIIVRKRLDAISDTTAPEPLLLCLATLKEYSDTLPAEETRAAFATALSAARRVGSIRTLTARATLRLPHERGVPIRAVRTFDIGLKPSPLGGQALALSDTGKLVIALRWFEVQELGRGTYLIGSMGGASLTVLKSTLDRRDPEHIEVLDLRSDEGTAYVLSIPR